MQTIGYIVVKNEEKIKVLVRQGKNCRYLKKRISGSDGVHLEDEELFLNEVKPQLIHKLLNGDTLSL